MARAPDCRVLLPPGPLALGAPFVARVEVLSDEPISAMTLSMVGTASWRGLRRREVEFFRMESTDGEDRPLAGGRSFQRTVHFEPPRTLPLPFRGERLRVRYELVVETASGELRADLDLVPDEVRKRTTHPSYRARLNESLVSIEVAIASQALAPGNELVGELSIETRDVQGEPRGDVRIQLLRRESWGKKSCEVEVAEANLPAKDASFGTSRAFVFPIPDDSVETISRPAFSCSWLLRFEVPAGPSTSHHVAFDVPIEIRRDAAQVGHVPRVGSARRSGVLEKYAEPPFRFVDSGLSVQHGVVEAGVVYEGVVYEGELRVTLRHPSLGFDPKTADPDHGAECLEQLYGSAAQWLHVTSETAAEFRIEVSNDASIRDALREVSLLIERVDTERLRLPAPSEYRVSLGTWRTLAKETGAELLPAGPRVHGSLRGRAFVAERGVTGLRLSVQAPMAKACPTEFPEPIREELRRSALSSVTFEDGWIVLSTPRFMGSAQSSVDAWEAAKFLHALSELADQWTWSGPYR